MSSNGGNPARRASAHDLAILRHPDRKTGWVQLIAATLERPRAGLAAICDRRLAAVNERAPIVGARLREETWVHGEPPSAIEVAGDPLEAPELLAPFDLASEAPVRVLVGRQGDRIALAVHHAALDGRGGVMLLHALSGGPLPEREAEVGAPLQPSRGALPLAALRRALRPADRVPPSAEPPLRDSLAARRLGSVGFLVVPRLAAAAIGAVAERSRAAGLPWRRIGLSIPVGGATVGIGNVATYRRVDLLRGETVHRAVWNAIKAGPTPGEFIRSPRSLRFLAPIADRFSDSLLVANHGVYDLPGISELEVFPVARGRSAVALGAAAVAGGESTIALRARDLSREDTEDLLERTIRRLEAKCE